MKTGSTRALAIWSHLRSGQSLGHVAPVDDAWLVMLPEVTGVVRSGGEIMVTGNFKPHNPKVDGRNRLLSSRAFLPAG